MVEDAIWFRLVFYVLERGFLPKNPGTCTVATGPKVTVADNIKGLEVDYDVSSPAAQFTILTTKDGAAVDLWQLYSSLSRASVNVLTEFFLASSVI